MLEKLSRNSWQTFKRVERSVFFHSLWAEEHSSKILVAGKDVQKQRKGKEKKGMKESRKESTSFLGMDRESAKGFSSVGVVNHDFCQKTDKKKKNVITKKEGERNHWRRHICEQEGASLPPKSSFLSSPRRTCLQN